MVGKLKFTIEGSVEEMFNLEDQRQYTDFYFTEDAVQGMYLIEESDELTMILIIGGTDYTLEYDEIIFEKIKVSLDSINEAGVEVKA